MSATKAYIALQKIKGFMPKSQYSTIVELMGGEEGQFFRDKTVEIANIIETMPKTYETDGQGKDAVAYLHYFGGACDFHIVEKDIGNGESDTRQVQAFGLANLGHGLGNGAELGYINIEELCENGMELDLHWTPVKLKELE